jgi:hypothetical protein
LIKSKGKELTLSTVKKIMNSKIIKKWYIKINYII